MFFGWQSINQTNFPPVLLISVCGQAIMAWEAFFSPPRDLACETGHVVGANCFSCIPQSMHTSINENRRGNGGWGCSRGRPCTIWLFNRSGKDTIPKIRTLLFFAWISTSSPVAFPLTCFHCQQFDALHLAATNLSP